MAGMAKLFPGSRLSIAPHWIVEWSQWIFGQRGSALLSVFNNYDVLLTNPDIFHYIMQPFYVRAGKIGDAADKVFAPMVNAFQQFTFDEFHL